MNKDHLQKLKQRLIEIYIDNIIELDIKVKDSFDRQLREDARALISIIDDILLTAKINEDQKQRILDHFKLYWERIESNTRLRYDTAFYLPFNQLCLAFSKTVEEDLQTTWAEILFPKLAHITDLYGSNINEFSLNDFLICGDENNNFLDIQTCFENAINHDAHNLTHTNQYQSGPNSSISLTSDEVMLLANRDSWTRKLHEDLYELQRSSGKVPGLNELQNLRNGLLQGDVHHLGDELNAAHPANIAMVEFQSFLESIEETQREKLFALEHNNESHSIRHFGELWESLCQPERDTGTNGLTIAACIFLRGQDLDAIIQHNRHILANVSYRHKHEKTEQALAEFTLFNREISLILTLITFPNGENINQLKDKIMEYYYESSKQSQQLIKTTLRLCLSYKLFPLMTQIIKQLHITNLSEFSEQLTNDMIINSPTDHIITCLPYISVTFLDSEGLSFLARSIIAKRTDLSLHILEHQPEASHHILNGNHRIHHSPCSMLKLAIIYNQIDIALLLLNNHADLKETFHKNAFMFCLHKKQERMAELIGQYILDNNIELPNGNENYYQYVNDINNSITTNSNVVFRVLIRIIPQPYLSDVAKKLILKSNTALMETLLTDFPHLTNLHLPSGETLLSFTIDRTKSKPMVETLLSQGADPNLHSKQKSLMRKTLISYPIIDAAKLGLTEIVDLLIANNADVDVKDYSGNNVSTFHRLLPRPP